MAAGRSQGKALGIHSNEHFWLLTAVLLGPGAGVGGSVFRPWVKTKALTDSY